MMKNPLIFLLFLLYFPDVYSQQPDSVDSTTLSGLADHKKEYEIGYGQQLNKHVATAISIVETNEFNAAGAVSPQQLFQGKVAGLQIFSEDGTPGANYDIFIRGQAMMKGYERPLIVVDGMPYIKDEIVVVSNPLDGINPGDIASVTVLRDVAASAIYGIRAENGAILISTKRGTKEKGIKLSYAGNFSLGNLPKQFDVFDASEYR